MMAPEANQNASQHATDAAAARASSAVRLAVAALAVLALGSAAYLWVVRGSAILLDLAHMGAKFLCL